MRCRPFLLAAVSVLAALFVTGGIASADTKTENQAAARALFEQGRALVARKDFDQACPKFEESQKLDPGAGTLFHLADCYERVGKTASAWAMFLDVASQSAASKRTERETAARERAATLRVNLSQVTIVVESSSAIDGLVIRRDDTEVGKNVWGTPVPVDPGTHRIEASAPGRKPWSTSTDVPRGPNNIEVRIPALPSTETAPAASTSAPIQPVAAPPKSSGRKTAGLVVGGAGVVAFGVSVALAMHARSKYNDASSDCTGSFCNQDGVDQRHSAVREGNIATVVGGVGLAAAAAGVVLYLTAPSGASKAPGGERAVAVEMGPTGLLLRGVW
jgi:hypothetical protein